MNHNRDIRAEQIVDRAGRALHESTVPPGPPPGTLQAVLAAGQSEAARKRTKTITERIFAMNRMTKVAAAIVIVAGIAGVLAWLAVGRHGATIAWADVQEKIRNARTVTFKAVLQPQRGATWKVSVMMKPGLIRQEYTQPANAIIIADLQSGRTLNLDKDNKEAILLQMPMDRDGKWYMLSQMRMGRALYESRMERLKELVEGSQSELGEKKVAGRLTKGYQVGEGDWALTIWADAQTGEPLQMEGKSFHGEMAMVMSDFDFDKDLDESLFRTEVPEGYTLRARKIISKVPSIEDMVVLLRWSAKASGGTFPDSPSAATVFRLALLQGQQDADREASDREIARASEDIRRKWGKELCDTFNRAWMLLGVYPEAQYAGKGVKLGDADTAVFWYKPKDSENHKVIYGDLTVKELAEEDLPVEPERPETEQGSGRE